MTNPVMVVDGFELLLGDFHDCSFSRQEKLTKLQTPATPPVTSFIKPVHLLLLLQTLGHILPNHSGLTS